MKSPFYPLYILVHKLQKYGHVCMCVLFQSESVIAERTFRNRLINV